MPASTRSALLATLVVACLGAFLLFARHTLTPLADPLTSASSPTPFPTSQPLSSDIPAASATFTPPPTPPPSDIRLTYAVKEPASGRVTVKQLELGQGHERDLFTYPEIASPGRSGSLWSYLPPNVALSPDGQTLAFIDLEGLKTHNLVTRQTASVITIVQPGDGTLPPTWSSSVLGPYTRSPISGVYGIHRPRWSASGRLLALGLAHWEGSGLAIVEVATGEASRLNASSFDYAWAPRNAQLLAITGAPDRPVGEPGTVYDEPSSLAIVPTESLKNARRMVTEPDPSTRSNMLAPVWSPTERFAGFLQCAPGTRLRTCRFNVLDVSTGHLTTVHEMPTDTAEEPSFINPPFWGKTEEQLYWIHRGSDNLVLSTHDVATGSSARLAMLPGTFHRIDHVEWLSDRLVVLRGITERSARIVGNGSSQLLLLDIETRSLTPVGPPLPSYTTILSVKRT